MPENDKIVLDITENEDSILDPSNNVKSIESDAVLKVINNSANNRIWNLKLAVGENLFTDLEKSYENASLNSSSSWDLPYKVTNLKEPILKLTETIDTSSQAEGINNNFVLDTQDVCKIKLELKNTVDKPITDIVVEKKIPDYLKELNIVHADGEADIPLNTNDLTWKIASLEPNSTVKVEIEGKTFVEDSEKKSGNEVKISYSSPDNYRSGIQPVLDAQSDTMSGIEQEEDDSTPGKWNCTLEFENESDFELTLREANVDQKTLTRDERVVELKPNEIIKPKATWTHEFSVIDQAVPKLSSSIDFTVNSIVEKRIFGKITKEPEILNVLSTDVVKVIDPPTVKANANTNMKITNTITNTGTAAIDSVKITDTIPEDFEPPTIEQISLKIVDLGDDLVKNLGSENVVMSISPDNTDSKVKHTISIEIKGVNAQFVPNNKLVIEYPIIARNPQPNVKYESPIETLSNTTPKSVGYSKSTAETPVIGIQYIQRKVKTMKSINPAGEGSYNVTIKITNKGGVELENISVVEEVPEGFIAGELKPEEIPHKYDDSGKLIKLTWEIARLDPDQSVKIKYVAEGSGEFPRVEPQVIVAEPESLKKGAGNVSSSSTSEASTETSSSGDSKADIANKKKIENYFDDFIAKVKKEITYNERDRLLEELKETLIDNVSITLKIRQIFDEFKQLESFGDKILFGDELDKFIEKVENWKRKLLE